MATNPEDRKAMSAGPNEGVLLFNLGTPDAPERSAVARYLREFLSDERVVNLPRWFWLPLLNFVIVPLRAGQSARAYSRVWTKDGSPLLYLSRKLTTRLQESAGPSQVFALGMRYGTPSISEALQELRSAGVQSLTVLPLYPQFSYTTTASGYDAVDEALKKMNWNPGQHRIDDYHVDSNWVQAVAGQIRRFRDSHGRAERLLFSMHGIPQRYVEAGDPYQAQCENSVALLVKELGLADDEWMLTYQSRLGREPWLQPYTDLTLKALAGQGVRHVQVVCPGFAVDCLETLEEVAMENAERFIESGGDKLEYVPALNDSDEHAEALLKVIDKTARG
jgi:ferrochelatase